MVDFADDDLLCQKTFALSFHKIERVIVYKAVWYKITSSVIDNFIHITIHLTVMKNVSLKCIWQRFPVSQLTFSTTWLRHNVEGCGH